MDILASKPEALDKILLFSKNMSKTLLTKQLENYDKYLYINIDHKRFKLIKFVERTLLTTIGIVKFKRRYYFDEFRNKYVFLLDNQVGIPTNVRMSNELILKILSLASIMTYSEVGKHLSDEFELSKFTIWNTIHNTVVESYFDNDIDREGKKIHVQIDEKFININPSKKRNAKHKKKNKRRYYTLTIFTDYEEYGTKGKRRLLNKTLISSCELRKLFKRLNEILIDRYKVTIDEEIFVSGDYASYIQKFGENILCCKTKYVPDKFHTYKAIKDAFPDLYVDDWTLNNANFQQHLIKMIRNSKNKNVKKIATVLKKNPEIFKPYLDISYLGCSQEGQNSHVYAPRFGKYANRFLPSTIEKLSLVREARAHNSQICICNKKRLIQKKLDLDVYEYDFSERYKDALDTSQMKDESRKIFNTLKYGNWYTY